MPWCVLGTDEWLYSLQKNDISLFTILSSLSADFLYLNIPIKIKLIDARHCTSTKSLQKAVKNVPEIKSDNKRGIKLENR